MYTRIASQKEIRLVSCNLCWTSPSENTKFGENISIELVQNLAMDLFVVAAASAATALEDPTQDPDRDPTTVTEDPERDDADQIRG